MSLAPGTRIGSYVIEAPLGAGGMGEVYRALDTKLNRDVALKVLPDAFASDPDRLARFSREAQLLASLNHPNIAAIYGFEESAPRPALVLELVEGPTLTDLIAASSGESKDSPLQQLRRGGSSASAKATADRRSALREGWSDPPGALPLDQALAIARQIAEALEAAHEHGVIHRDLKPANIKVRPDGTVKVLDFGLAKAMEDGASEAGSAGGAGGMSQSPTMTSPAMTRIGIILGTASYMSPEQARGLVVDRRADIWAWACVLFEMLAGRRAFDGADTTEVIAAVVRGEPDWSQLPVDTPDELRRLLRRCLEKDRKKRFADIRDVRFTLDDAQSQPAKPVALPRTSNRRERLAWAGALLLSIAGTAAVLWRSSEGTAGEPTNEMRVEIATPPTTDPASLSISPNGEHLAFVAFNDGRPMLWLRSLITGEARPLTGTDGASFPFWSPDSRSVGFFANERLNRIDVDGGALRTLAAAAVGAGGTWNREGVILFTIVPDAGMSRVSHTGGEVLDVPTSQRGPGGNRFPQFLPDGRHYLYFMAEMDVRGVYAGTLDGPERTHLFDADAAAVFVPPAQILFTRAGTLFVQRFDPARLALEGTAVPLARGVAVDNNGSAALSASSVGSLVYRLGSGNRQRQIVWFDRSGTQIGEAFPPDANNPTNTSLSSDGRQLAMTRVVAGNADVWLLDLDRRGAFRRISNAPTPDIAPVWSPDGKRITYGAGRGRGSFALVERPTATVGDESLLFDTPAQEIPVDWSDDGRFILYRQQPPGSGQLDLWALPMDGNRTPIPVAASPGDERHGQFSPDSKWVAFESNESGRYEVYVQPFPGPAAGTVVSTGGGRQARWSRDGKELFYIAPDARLMAVSLRFQKDGQTVDPASPTPLFQTRLSSTVTGGSVVEYDVSKAGTFLMNTLVVDQTAPPITLILNLGSPQE